MLVKNIKYKTIILLWNAQLVRKLFSWILLPVLIYFTFFCFYSWPWIIRFSDYFFTDNGDGLQNIWNMWWINKSVIDLHQLPWYTSYLHYPGGVTLLGQTLNPFNGFVGIVLLHVFNLNLAQAFNTMIIFSFVMGGLSAFWLCYYFTKKYLASLIGGFIFTFSSYHFAHAIGHMQLVSLEWLPLFILLWWRFLRKPSYRLALAASLTLLLVLLCDYYYFLYSVAVATLIFIYLFYKKEIPSLKAKKTFLPLTTFIASSLVLVAPLPLALLRLNSQDPLSGSHPSREFSTDGLTPFIDGGFWRFHPLTDWYWHRIPTFVGESSVYLGVSVIILIIIALFKRNNLGKYTNFWLVTGLSSGILSLGPRLRIFGHTLDNFPLPYALLEKILPPLKLSGTPIRMMVIVSLAAAIISAIVLAKLKLSTRKGKLIIGVFSLVLFVEMWPATLPQIATKVPQYVYELKSLPRGGVYDSTVTNSTGAIALFNQTIHEKPIALGYISRTPRSVERRDQPIINAVLQNKQYLLCSFKIRYYTTPSDKLLVGDYKVIYTDKETTIYDLKNSDSC